MELFTAEMTKILEEIFKLNKTRNIYLIIIIILINLGFSGLQLWFTYKQNVKIQSSCVKKEHEILIVKELFREITHLRANLLDRNLNTTMIEHEIPAVREKIATNEIVLSNQTFHHMNELLDLCLEVVVGGDRNIKEEELIIRKIKAEFRTI